VDNRGEDVDPDFLQVKKKLGVKPAEYRVFSVTLALPLENLSRQKTE
jgi:hypothetical protein